MRIVCLSDTHNQLSKLTIPDGDILLHAGDFCGHGKLDEVAQFNREMGLLPHKHKVVIAGNHDWPLQRQHQLSREMLTNVLYLEDESVEIEGLKIYGSPWQPEFFNWAFNLPRKSRQLQEKWTQIPSDADIVITHGPPHGILDATSRGTLAGCELLRTRLLEELHPRVHLFGHIHEGYGWKQIGNTLFLNAANLNEHYRPVNPPVAFDLEPGKAPAIVGLAN